MQTHAAHSRSSPSHPGAPSAAILHAAFVAAVILGMGTPFALAAESGSEHDWWAELWDNVQDPWFLFGMLAQFIFFLRFLVQWIVSEKHRRSTIPVSFWYLSLVGGIAIFVYAVHEAQPVFIIAQGLSCVIYIRNLMLIHGRSQRLKRAGLPADAGALRVAESVDDKALAKPRS